MFDDFLKRFAAGRPAVDPQGFIHKMYAAAGCTNVIDKSCRTCSSGWKETPETAIVLWSTTTSSSQA